jgi:tripartite-type tricarboxylate transporter receptor subunit TctC
LPELRTAWQGWAKVREEELKRRHLLGAAAIAVLSRRASAQTFLERPLRFVVPYAPGGSTDTSARIVAEKLSVLLGQQVIVENKPGGGTIIGTEIVARAKPDGHTILLTPAALIANAAFGVTVPYDIDKDLIPVIGFVDLPMLLAASNSAPFKSVAELLAWAKADSGRTVAYASAGIGSLTHLWGEYVKARTGLPMEHVGYKGSAEALRDVMAGHVPLFADVLVPTATAIRLGQLRGLAVAMARRSELLPGVPTVAEAGLPGMEGSVPFGISVPGGTPVSLVLRLNIAFNQALADSVTRRKLIELGFVPVGGAPQDYSAVLATEIAKWRKVIKDSKIPPPT